MSFHNLDLNLLRVFDVIYTERNLTRAANILHISQPAVSNALHRLREVLHDPLFVRERRGVAPTPFADSLAPSIHSALQLVRSGLSSIEDFSSATSSRTFRISLNDHVESLLLPSLVATIAREAPNINIVNSYIGRHDLPGEMALGAIDIAVDVPLASDERVEHKDICTEGYVCMVRKDHPVLGQKFDLETYLSLDHVHVSGRRHGLGHVDRVLADKALSRNIKLRTRNLELSAKIIQDSDYTMTLPARFANYYGLATIPLPFKVPDLHWRLHWPVRAEYDRGNIWLREMIAAIGQQFQHSTTPQP